MRARASGSRLTGRPSTDDVQSRRFGRKGLGDDAGVGDAARVEGLEASVGVLPVHAEEEAAGGLGVPEQSLLGGGETSYRTDPATPPVNLASGVFGWLLGVASTSALYPPRLLK